MLSLLPSFLISCSPSPALPEKLIEGLKSPEPALLLPDLLPLADPFGSTSDAANGKIPSVPGVYSYLCIQPLPSLLHVGNRNVDESEPVMGHEVSLGRERIIAW